MSRVFVKPCELCGTPIEYTYNTKSVRYCPECKAKREAMLVYARNERRREKTIIEARAVRIAHQQDTTIWTHDYAERQKAKTLAMIGGIKV